MCSGRDTGTLTGPACHANTLSVYEGKPRVSVIASSRAWGRGSISAPNNASVLYEIFPHDAQDLPSAYAVAAE